MNLVNKKKKWWAVSKEGVRLTPYLFFPVSPLATARPGNTICTVYDSQPFARASASQVKHEFSPRYRERDRGGQFVSLMCDNRITV